MTRKNETDRVVEAQIEVAAPADAVWKALTDARELTRWFPLHARVEPGAGGSIWLSWEGLYEGESRIQIWEPGRHLRTGWVPAEGADRPDALELMVDYHIESRGDVTVLRIVHSGFGREGQWDDEYDGVRRGWDFELRSLRHYLENHRGQDRRAIWIRQPVGAPAVEIWAALTSPGKMLKDGALDGLGKGDRYAVTLATGDRLEGIVQISTPPTDFAGTVTSMGNGLFRMGYEDFFQPPEAILWLSTWGVSAGEVEAIRGRWQKMLAELLG